MLKAKVTKTPINDNVIDYGRDSDSVVCDVPRLRVAFYRSNDPDANDAVRNNEPTGLFTVAGRK